jgi:hypothetical protein
MPFTFKKNKRVFMSNSKTTDIKIKGMKVGYIRELESGQWRTLFMVKKEPTEIDPAPFKWISLKTTYDNEEQARMVLNELFTLITRKFDLHHSD